MGLRRLSPEEAAQALETARLAKRKADEALAQVGEPAEVPDVVATKMAEAYYPRAIAFADSARTRAQAGYTIASAVAAALVAAGLFGDLNEREGWIQFAGVAALVTWLIAAFEFMRAVAVRRRDPEQHKPEVERFDSPLAWVDAILLEADNEREGVERHLRRAVHVVAIALTLTTLTIVGVLVERPDDPARRGAFTLFPAGQTAVDEVCTETVTMLEGSVDPGKLKDQFVPVTVDAGSCRETKTTLQLRKRHIAVVALGD